MLATLARAGRFVVAVDTLADAGHVPPRGAGTVRATLAAAAVADGTREHHRPAARARRTVVAWAGAGSLDEVLRDVTRIAMARTVTA